MACAQLEAGGNRLLLEGVRPEVLETLQRNDLVDRIGSENIFRFSSELHSALDAAWEAAQEMVSRAPTPSSADLAPAARSLQRDDDGSGHSSENQGDFE
jgi:hypothetical protein